MLPHSENIIEHSCDYLCYTSNCRANGGAAVFASKRPSMRNRLTTPSRSSSNCIAVFAKRCLRLGTLRPIAISLGKLPAKRQLPSEVHPRYHGALASTRLADSQLLQNCIRLDTLEEEFMEVRMTREFKKWFGKLRNGNAKSAIALRIGSVQLHEQISGDWKPLGEGILELRFHIGPGYRVYAAREGSMLLLLLLGGNKASQQRDIKHAKRILKKWRNSHAR